MSVPIRLALMPLKGRGSIGRSGRLFEVVKPRELVDEYFLPQRLFDTDIRVFDDLRPFLNFRFLERSKLFDG